MRGIIFAAGLLATTVAGARTVEHFQADKASLSHYRVPEWYKDAKFGIWPIWGVYSVPAYRGVHAAEWYGIWMHCVEKEPETIKDSPKQRWNDYFDLLGLDTAKHHRETYGDPSEFGYHDLIPMWKAEKWNPEEWAQFAEDAGARFFTMLGTFHDGFSTYDSAVTEWDSVDKGPHRDLCADMKKALRARGLKFGISNHFAWNSAFYKYYFNNGFSRGREAYSDLYSKGVVDEEYLQRWWKRTVEMVDLLDPDLYYFDWGWHGQPWVDGGYHEKFAAYYYNHALECGKSANGHPEVVLNSKFRPMAGYCVHDLERAKESRIQPHIWQTDTSVSEYSWGYATDDEYKTPKHLIVLLVDIVSKNGILMLAFGPRADGTIPDEYKIPMLEMGRWLKANGEAIYATRPWKIAEEGPTDSGNEKLMDSNGWKDLRYTRSKDGKKLYVISFGLPRGRLALLSTRVNKQHPDACVTMLSNGRKIPFEVNARQQLVLDLSGIRAENAGCRYAFAYRLEGFDLEAHTLTALERSEAYLLDEPDYTPLSKAYVAGFPWLSGLNALYEKAHNGVRRDTNYYGKTIRLGGAVYEHGLMVCPAGTEGRGIFLIGTDGLPAVKRFTATIGIEAAISSMGSSEFIIEIRKADQWERLYSSGVLTFNDDPVKVDVAIPKGARYIRFITTDGGNGGAADHAVWADARFVQ